MLHCPAFTFPVLIYITLPTSATHNGQPTQTCCVTVSQRSISISHFMLPLTCLFPVLFAEKRMHTFYFFCAKLLSEQDSTQSVIRRDLRSQNTYN